MHTRKQNKDLGTVGEKFVLERLINKGFILYKRNIRQWGFEIDLIVYKYNPVTKFLDIRIVEVKTRISAVQTYLGTLSNYDIENKWRRIRGRFFMFREEIVSDTGLEVVGSLSHFDLAIVFLKSPVDISSADDVKKNLRMHTYIKDVNLFI